MSEFVELARYLSRAEADVAAGMLESGGVKTIIHADDAAGLRPELIYGMGVKLFVQAHEFELAREVLNIEVLHTENSQDSSPQDEINSLNIPKKCLGCALLSLLLPPFAILGIYYFVLAHHYQIEQRYSLKVLLSTGLSIASIITWIIFFL